MKDLPVLPQPVHVRELGQGPRRVLALHCTIAHSGAWKGLAERLAQEATFIAPDMLSHGRSPDWDRQGDFYDRITEIARTQLTEPMDVIGHSFGAAVALRLAAEHPDLVRSAVLVEPVFFAVAKQDAPELIDKHHHDAEPYLDALAEGDEAMAARLFNRMWSTDDSPRWPQLPESTRAAMIRGIHVVPTVEQALFADRVGLLQPGILDRATMPILLMRGSLTHPVIAAINEGLARRFPDATSVVVEGAGHMLPITHPTETAEHVRALWARV
ncbi:alpha/beta hydrolase [Ruegeria marisrubri]|uniref:Alpha/beta hydrolase n=1 Tax=Ruegeria marisrubri TaxID=1685379 RepID=A0A0X3TC98_9RHOB|nr:alpha/beta hydrolase [Ruegeria marisrubri]KUJ73398.1 alpha/beta hydrolase [Ruegeria marisrubri]